MKIGVDLDEILSDTLTSVLEYYNSVHKTNLKRNEFVSYNYWEIWGGTKENAVKLIEDYYKTNYFKNIKPIAGAKENLENLKSEGYEMFVITGRSDKYKKETKDWLTEHYPNIFSDIFFANTFDIDNTDTKKSDICIKNNIPILIEDDPHHLADCAQAGIKTIVLDCPWNKNFQAENSVRVFFWEEIAQKIKEFI
jgi:5'(3')-deoxyribonucleotidase